MRFLQEVVTAVDDLVLVIEPDGTLIESFNADDKSWLVPGGNVPGQHIADVLPQCAAESLAECVAGLHASGSSRVSFRFHLDMPGGIQHFACELCLSSSGVQGGPVRYIVLVRNFTDQVQQGERVLLRERLLLASAVANELLLKNRDTVEAVSVGLREIGHAMGVDRCYLFETPWSAELGERVCNQRYEWSADRVEPQIDNPDLQNIPFSSSRPFVDPLLANRPFVCLVRELEEGILKQTLAAQDILSLVAFPIFLGGELWGFVGFDDCTRERGWTNVDMSILASFCTSIASALARKQTEDDLVAAKEEADRANHAKSAFLSNMTHELRTPLHGVVGYAEMLSAFGFPEPEAGYFRNLKLSANTLYELINNILDFSKIEAGVFEYSPENCLLADIIDSSLAAVSYLRASSGSELQVDLQPDLPGVVRVDATRLKQILVNLLSNALKFTNKGRVGLKVGLVAGGIEFVVEDTGIGISADHQSVMFTPFTQLDHSISKKYQGSGLGLSITKHILGQMGSEPRLVSKLGVGTTVSFVLPMDLIAPRGNDNLEVVFNPDVLKQRVFDLLVVEDNRLNMMLVETVLRDIAPLVRVHKAYNGIEALQLVRNGLKPMIVLMDLQMPIMDGFETTKGIRELYQGPMVVAALTASAISDIRDRCFEVGMDDFLTKPFTREQVAGLLLKHSR